MLSGAERKRLLFVDDDEQILRAIARVLERDRHRWDLTFVVGGEAAIATLRDQTFDVVVTDFDMPVVDGTAVLAATRRYCERATRILLTGSVVDAATVDADVVMAKPFSPDQLRDVLERVCSASADRS